MSDPLDGELLDVTVGTLKRLKIMALDNYNKAYKENPQSYSTTWWDGYMRGLEHVYEAHKQ
jgi:hypothetical protein